MESNKPTKIVDHRHAPEVISGKEAKRFLNEALKILREEDYDLVSDQILVTMPFDKLPDDIEIPVHMMPRLKHKHLQQVPSIVEIFHDWFHGKLKPKK